MEQLFMFFVGLVSVGFLLFVSFIVIMTIGIVILTIMDAIDRNQEIKELEKREQEQNILKALGKYKDPIDEKNIQIKKINEEIEKEHFFKFGLKKRRKNKK